ncbi:MAG TPA: helix-turn-helix domain-containing protein [Pyrinomonadaceae bacterium]|nr:helix-turn-helix domain-containing protein [Pyrinomonadaceae bacterium]
MANTTDKSKLLTVREVAERLDVAPSTVRIWRIAGRFPNAQAEETARGRVWYIPESDLEGFEKRGPGRPPTTSTKLRKKSKKK